MTEPLDSEITVTRADVWAAACPSCSHPVNAHDHVSACWGGPADCECENDRWEAIAEWFNAITELRKATR